MYNSPNPPAPDRRMPESPPISEWWYGPSVDAPIPGYVPTESSNLANLALTLNQLSSDMVTQQRTGGGTGGGSEVLEKDPMETNRFVSMNLNPYLTDNVHSFKYGGRIPKYADGGYQEFDNDGNFIGGSSTSSSSSTGNTNYSVNPYQSPEFSHGYDGGAEENRINKIRETEFREQNNLNPYPVQITGGSSTDPYQMAFEAEKERRANEAWLQSLKDGTFGQIRPTDTLKNPWEAGYDNWWTPPTANKGMKYKYDGGGISMLKNPQGNTPSGHFANKANETIARAQLANMFVRKANKGMEYKYGGDYYKEGGNYPHNMYHPETGYKIVAQDESAHNNLAKAGFGHTPKAAYGMKMKKNYTQGGRF